MCALLLSHAAWAATANVTLQRDADGLHLSATTSWQPAPAVLDALQRGVPMSFIMQARVVKPRWYWLDKTVQTTTRVKRLAYQPLTRQWRISSSTDLGADGTGGLALHQNVDDLETALALITRAKHWRIASAKALNDALGDAVFTAFTDTKSEGSTTSDLSVRFTFKLDLSALPRPFQIGVNDNPDWQLSIDNVYSVPAASVVQDTSSPPIAQEAGQ